MAQTKAQLIDPVDGTIVNADISSNNADRIAGSKINPVFTSNVEIQNNAPGITFTDGDQDNDFYIQLNSGVLNFVESQTAANRIAIDSNGNVTVTGNLIINTGYLEMQSQSIFIIDTIAHAGDTDTKMRFPSNDVISFETAGADRFAIGTTEVVVNDPGNSIDFRVEGDTEPNLLFVDASADQVSIGTSSPSDVFDVVHAANAAAGISIRNTNNSQAGAMAQLLIAGGDNSKGRLKIETNGAFHTIDEDSNGNLIIEDNGTERLRVDSNGNVMIGAPSATNIFTVQFSDSSTSISDQVPQGLRINNTDNTLGRLSGLYFTHGGGGSANNGIFSVSKDTASASTNAGSDLAFYMKTNGQSLMTEKMRIDASGRLLVGGTASVAAWGQNNRFQVQGNGWDNAGGAIVKLADNNNSPNLIFAASRGSSPGTAVQNNDHLGFIVFNGDDGTDIETVGAFIRAKIDGTVASNRIDTQLDFATHSAGSTTERVRIHPTGEVTIPGGVTLGTTIDVHSADQTLDDYEEGTWTPNNVNFSTYTNVTWDATYIKIGRMVFFNAVQTAGTTNWGVSHALSGLPFPVQKTGAGSWTNNAPSEGGNVLIWDNEYLYFAQARGAVSANHVLRISGVYQTTS